MQLHQIASVSSGASWDLLLGSSITQPLDGLQLMQGCEVGIAQGYANRLVPHQFLHTANVHARHDEAAGKRMSEIVPAKVADPSLRQAPTNHSRAPMVFSLL